MKKAKHFESDIKHLKELNKFLGDLDDFYD